MASHGRALPTWGTKTAFAATNAACEVASKLATTAAAAPGAAALSASGFRAVNVLTAAASGVGREARDDHAGADQETADGRRDPRTDAVLQTAGEHHHQREHAQRDRVGRQRLCRRPCPLVRERAREHAPRVQDAEAQVDPHTCGHDDPALLQSLHRKPPSPSAEHRSVGAVLHRHPRQVCSDRGTDAPALPAVGVRERRAAPPRRWAVRGGRGRGRGERQAHGGEWSAVPVVGPKPARAGACRSPRRARRRSPPRRTLRTTLPLAKIRPTPLPAATPMSASRLSPGPLTTHPMTATLIGARDFAQPARDLLGDGDEVDLAAAARGAADHLGPAPPQIERGQDVPRDADLLDRVGGQRDAHRVADPLLEQDAEADGGLHRAASQRPGLGHAEVQGVRHGVGEAPVGVDRGTDRGRLRRDDDVVESAAPSVLAERDGARDELVGECPSPGPRTRRPASRRSRRCAPGSPPPPRLRGPRRSERARRCCRG